MGPSLEDAFGLPALEAMACGLPVIASSNAGVSEIVEDKVSGLLLRNTKDAVELASLMERLFSDSRLRELLSCNAIEASKTYTWDSSAAALWHFLNEGLAEKRSLESRSLK